MSEVTAGSQNEWEKAFRRNIVRVGEAFGNWGSILDQYVDLELVDDDSIYNPLPNVYEADARIKVKCHPDATEIWDIALGHIPELHPYTAEDLYMASAASLIELNFLIFSAGQTDMVLGDRTAVQRAVGRASNVINSFHDKEQVELLGLELELLYGFTGLADRVKELKAKDIQELNRMRYALAKAIFALELDETSVEAVKSAFRDRLHAENDRQNDIMLEFLRALVTLEDFVMLQMREERIKQKSLSLFLLAGTSPMNYR